MKNIFINNKENIYFKQAWQLYLSSFPQEERRTINEQEKTLENKNYQMTCYIENKQIVSILFFWKIKTTYKEYTFLEHFAVNKDLRGKSYGSKILQNFIKEHKNIVLEIEPIVDEITKKRLSFYEKFDFTINKHKHLQVPFRKNAQELELLLLSQNMELSKDEYEDFYEKLKENIYLE